MGEKERMRRQRENGGGGGGGEETDTYLVTPKTQATAMNSANPTSSRGRVPANWSKSSNKYTPLPRTNGNVTR